MIKVYLMTTIMDLSFLGQQTATATSCIPHNSVYYVVVQFCPWFKFYFPLFLGMVMYDNEFETMKNKI